MRVILIGGGETIETIYFLARDFGRRRYQVTVVSPDPGEAATLARQVEATVMVGDGSEPAVLEAAGARRADAVLALTPNDPDNLVVCQIAQRSFGVPQTIALVNDPDNEAVFQQLGVSIAFSATRILGTLIEGHTIFEDMATVAPMAEGRVNVTEVTLSERSPAAGQSLSALRLPPDSLIACIIRDGHVIVPRGQNRLEVDDRVLVITLPENHEDVVRALTGDED
jgi:trk system potassium uptake protein TrkA